LEELRQRKIDACMIRRVKSEVEGVHQVIIARDRLMLALPSNHPKARAEKVALDDVVEECFLQFSSEKNISKRTAELWRRAGVAPRNIQICDNGLTILAMVARGAGVAILASTLTATQMPNVVWKPIDIDEQLTASEIVMLYRADPQNAKMQSRFVDYVRRFCSGPLSAES
jgi:DNA-binding transcriptional LysR family regulator